MGHFFAASAFRDTTPDALATATADYGLRHSVRTTVVTEPYPINDSTDALFYPTVAGWTIASWPNYFNIHDVPLCAAVTKALGIVAVTVNVYDGDYWSMEVLRSGGLIDRFSPWGDYFAKDEVTAAADRLKFQGDPAAVASVLECPVEVLKPYYRYVGDQAVGMAVPGDEFPLEDFWVFTDIWRRFGASYPTNPEVFAARARFARRFTTRLPTWNGEPLGDPAA